MLTTFLPAMANLYSLLPWELSDVLCAQFYAHPRAKDFIVAQIKQQADLEKQSLIPAQPNRQVAIGRREQSTAGKR
jgi:hypothetical protein